MNLTGIVGFRLTCLFALCAAASGQPGPGEARVIVVDSPGTLVNPASRSVPARSGGREIERNESNAKIVFLDYVDAQLTHFWSARRADGGLAFAGEIRSAAGVRDGLYWPLDAGGEESPVGPKFAGAAAAELDPVRRIGFLGITSRFSRLRGRRPWVEPAITASTVAWLPSSPWLPGPPRMA